MNLTPAERAAMVRDLTELAEKYKAGHMFYPALVNVKLYKAMELNYSALASALKEGLTFQGVA